MNKVVKVVKVANKGIKGRIQVAIQRDSVDYFDGTLRVSVFCDNGTMNEKLSSVAELELAEGCIGESIPRSSQEGTEFLASELSRKFAYCLLAVDSESARYALGGVCWEDDWIVATDGRRMHVQQVGLAEDMVNEKRTRIIPSRAVATLLQLLRQFQDDIVRVYFSERAIVVNGNCWILECELVQGRFPNWRQVLPGEGELQETENVLFVKQFREHLKAEIKRKKLEEKVGTSTMSKSEKKSYRGELALATVDIGGMRFNAAYILDGIANIENATTKPLLAKSGNGACRIGDCIVMPYAK
jgi:DNA polymerase III sliding clamp (beta) subunit (PCNA family)